MSFWILAKLQDMDCWKVTKYVFFLIITEFLKSVILDTYRIGKCVVFDVCKIAECFIFENN